MMNAKILMEASTQRVFLISLVLIIGSSSSLIAARPHPIWGHLTSFAGIHHTASNSSTKNGAGFKEKEIKYYGLKWGHFTKSGRLYASFDDIDWAMANGRFWLLNYEIFLTDNPTRKWYPFIGVSFGRVIARSLLNNVSDTKTGYGFQAGIIKRINESRFLELRYLNFNTNDVRAEKDPFRFFEIENINALSWGYNIQY
jgi:hypothetical protein